MTPLLPARPLRDGLTLLIVVACSSAVLANGRHFFAPAGKNAKVDLVYFGDIKDRATGRPLDFVDVTVLAQDMMMTFPFSNDRPGHYRSPDVGLAIKAAGGTVNTSQLEIVCFAEGYAEVRRSVPRKSAGIIEVDCVMDKDGSAQTESSAVPTPPPPNRSRVPAMGLFVLLVSAVAARTSGRRRSTTR